MMRPTTDAEVSQRLDRFPLKTHSIMLGDLTRVNSFRSAIHAILEPSDSVCDIGAGTGILAWIAAQSTSGRVIGIEADGATCQFARELFASSPGRAPEIYHGLSFGRPVDFEPNIVVSETLGPLGLEESIVEICGEFATRYPSVRAFIPEDVEIVLQAIDSAQVDKKFDSLLGGFLSASIDGLDYNAVRGRIEQSLDNSVVECACGDGIERGPEIVVARFKLGHDKVSRFRACAMFNYSEPSYVSVFFRSNLAPGISLSNAWHGAENHWGKFFLRKPLCPMKLAVLFDNVSRHFQFSWTRML